jgi:hypothetical protein
MNRKQFIILLALVAVVGAAGLLIRQRDSNSWQGGSVAIGQKLLPNLAVNDVAQITIMSGTNELNLARRDNLWRVHERGDYPANFSQISELLLKFADLKIAQTEDIGPSLLGRFELLPPGSATNCGTLIEFKDQGGKTLNSVRLGKNHMKKPAAGSRPAGMDDEGWPDGRYVLAGADAKTVALVSDPLETAQPGPDRWLSKDFLSIEKPSAISAQFPDATNSWKLTRASQTNDWQLADAKPDEKPDASNMSSVTSPFSSANFNDIAPLKSAGATTNTVLTVQTFDGFTYIARIAPKRDTDYPVSFSIAANIAAERAAARDEKPEDKTRLDKEFKDSQDKLREKLARESQFTNWVYFIPAFTIDPMIKTRTELTAEVKKDEPPQAGN